MTALDEKDFLRGFRRDYLPSEPEPLDRAAYNLGLEVRVSIDYSRHISKDMPRVVSDLSLSGAEIPEWVEAAKKGIENVKKAKIRFLEILEKHPSLMQQIKTESKEATIKSLEIYVQEVGNTIKKIEEKTK